MIKRSKHLPVRLDATSQQAYPQREDVAARALADLSVLQSTVFVNMTETTDVYLEFVRSTLGMCNAIITTLDFRYLHVINACNRNGCDIPVGSLIPTENTFCQYVRATGTPVIVTDATQDARVMNLPTQKDFGIQAYLGVPLVLSNGAIYGTLCVLNTEPHEFSSSHVAIVTIVARHIALLLECTLPRLTNQTHPTPIEQTSDTSDTQNTVFDMVIHDLRNPVSGIQGYIEMFLGNILGPLTDDQRTILARMGRSTQFINRLITDLIDTAAAKTGTLSLLTERFDPFAVGQSVLEMFHDEAIDRELTLRIDGTSNVPMMIGDKDRVQQILANLVGNALRHAATGEVLLHVTTQGNTIRFAVQDTGPGIAKDAQTAVWQKHTRLAKEGRGLGLGLHIVQQLTQAMGGTCGVDSTPGQGSTFWVYLPVQGALPQKVKFHSA